MMKHLPYWLFTIGIIAVIASMKITAPASPHTLLEEQESERLAILGMIGFASAVFGAGWIAIRVLRRIFSSN